MKYEQLKDFANWKNEIEKFEDPKCFSIKILEDYLNNSRFSLKSIIKIFEKIYEIIDKNLNGKNNYAVYFRITKNRNGTFKKVEEIDKITCYKFSKRFKNYFVFFIYDLYIKI